MLEPRTPEENIVRGTLFSLLAIPVGVIVFVFIWNLGFIASIVSFGTAWLAVFLYRLGAGGIISRIGAFCITGVVVVAVGLSIFAGLVSDVAIGVGRVADISPFVALTMPEFWQIFNEAIGDSEAMGSVALPIVLAIVFAALGVFNTLRGIFRAQDAAPVAPAAAQAPWPQQAPAAEWQQPAQIDEPRDPKAPNV